MNGRTSSMPKRGAPNLALAAALGLIGVLTLYAAISASLGGHWLSSWRGPLSSLAGLWLAAAIILPLLERRRREAPPDSGDLGCWDRY